MYMYFLKLEYVRWLVLFTCILLVYDKVNCIKIHDFWSACCKTLVIGTDMQVLYIFDNQLCKCFTGQWKKTCLNLFVLWVLRLQTLLLPVVTCSYVMWYLPLYGSFIGSFVTCITFLKSTSLKIIILTFCKFNSLYRSTLI